MKTILTLAIAGILSGSPVAEPFRNPVLVKWEGPAIGVPPQSWTYGNRTTRAGSYLAGRHAQQEQDWKQANRYMDNLLAIDPGNADLSRKAMILAMGGGHKDKAMMFARKVLEKDPRNVLALFFLAVDEFSREDYKKAKTRLEDIPDEPMTELLRPLLLAWASTADKVMPGPAPEDNPLYAYHSLLIASYLGKLEPQLETYLDKILQAPTIDVYELEKIADIHAQLGKKDKAIELYKLIDAQQPGDGAVQKKIEMVEKNKDIGKLSTFTPVKSPREGAAEALFDVARILYQQNGDDSARVFANLALILNSRLSEANILMANLLARHERYDDAIGYYKLIGPEDDSYAAVQRSAAEFMEESGRVEEAVGVLETLVKNEKDIDAQIQIGDIYRHNDKFTQAAEAYNKAEIMMGGKIPAAYWHLFYARGMTFERLNEWSRAETDLQKALQYQPDHPYVLNYLGYSWADQGKNLDQALKMIEKAVSLRPNDGYITDSLGWVLFRLGKLKDAVPRLERAVELLPYDSTVNDHLGDAYWRVGRRMEAQFQWQRALNHSDDQKLSDAIRIKLVEGLPAPGTVQAQSKDEAPLNP